MAQGRRANGGRCGPAAAALTAVLSLAACDVDGSQAALCRRIIGAFERDPAQVTVLRTASLPGGEDGVIMDYRVPEPPGENDRPFPETQRIDADDSTDSHWIACRFRGDAFPWSYGREDLVEVSSDRVGSLSGVQLQMLKLWLRLEPGDGGGPKQSIRRRPSVWRSRSALPSRAWVVSAARPASP